MKLCASVIDDLEGWHDCHLRPVARVGLVLPNQKAADFGVADRPPTEAADDRMSYLASVADPAQLPQLLSLLDDESQMVRDSVCAELLAFGEDLDGWIAQLDPVLSEARLMSVRAVLGEYREREAEFRTGSPVGPLLGSALFATGELVRHRRYDYRGVVVALDRRFEGDEEWYLRNRSQPEREQPWYHVFVHGSNAVTYAAQTSLLPDEECAEIGHPLLARFFDGFDGARYRRNELAWPRER